MSADAYRQTGLQAFWVRVEFRREGVWYRVLIDCYPDAAAALAIIREKDIKNARSIRIR
jgi:hypothetical protein